MPKEAWELLIALKGYSRCKLCRLDSDVQEKIWQWFKEGRTYFQIADFLGCSEGTVFRHKQHMLKALERYLKTKSERVDELKQLEMQIQIEREKRKQLELAREREERAKAALDALKDLVSRDKYEKIVEILSEGDGS